MPATRKAPVSAARARVMDAGTAVDSCEFVVHYLVLAMLFQLKHSWRRPARLIHMPRSVEAAIEIDLARSEDRHLKLRKDGNAQEIFGCPVIWDAEEFRIEF